MMTQVLLFCDQVVFESFFNISYLQTYAPPDCYVSEFEFLYSSYGQLWAVANEVVTGKAMVTKRIAWDPANIPGTPFNNMDQL